MSAKNPKLDCILKKMPWHGDYPKLIEANSELLFLDCDSP